MSCQLSVVSCLGSVPPATSPDMTGPCHNPPEHIVKGKQMSWFLAYAPVRVTK